MLDTALPEDESPFKGTKIPNDLSAFYENSEKPRRITNLETITIWTKLSDVSNEEDTEQNVRNATHQQDSGTNQ